MFCHAHNAVQTFSSIPLPWQETQKRFACATRELGAAQAHRGPVAPANMRAHSQKQRRGRKHRYQQKKYTNTNIHTHTNSKQEPLTKFEGSTQNPFIHVITTVGPNIGVRNDHILFDLGSSNIFPWYQKLVSSYGYETTIENLINAEHVFIRFVQILPASVRG